MVSTGRSKYICHLDEEEVTFLFTNQCEEIQLSLNQYIREFLAARIPGKMAHEARKVTEAETRKLFDEFDKDKGGTLDRQRCMLLLTIFGSNFNKDELDDFFVWLMKITMVKLI